jgi:ATP-binding cassette subfamily B protein
MLSTPDRGLLATYLRPELARAALLGLLLFAGIGLQLANPQIARSFIDGAQAGEPFGRLVRLALAFTAVALATQAAIVAETFVADDLGWRTTNALRLDLTRHVLELDGSFHAEHGAGELMERIDGDVGAIASFFSRFVVQVVGNAVFLVGVLVALFLVDWRVGGMLSLFAAAALLFMSRGGRFVGARSKAARAAAGDLSGYLEERLGGLPDLKTSGADAHALRRLQEHLAERYHRGRASVLAGSIFSGGVSTLFVLGTGASLVLAAVLHRSGTITLGSVFLVFRYTSMLRLPLEQLSRRMNSFQQATGGIVRVQELLDTRARVVDGPGAALPAGALAVELDHVSFAYEDDEPVLHGISLRIEPGEVVGLLGRTGSGKTTISRLLFRLYDPDLGTVAIGGVDARQPRLHELRRRIGLVTQEVQLFEGTLRDNVAMFDPRVGDDRLADVFAGLDLDDWLRRLPAGLDTVIGSGGRGLSAGEAQVVAMARVFLTDPGLVVLDEASSRLDPATERLLERAMTRLLDGRTGVVIAHRLPTVDRADTILILEDGRVAEHGGRAVLAADPSSRFARLRSAGAEEVLA